MSQALLEMNLKFIGTNIVAKGLLERTTAPLTIQAMMDEAPCSRRGMMNVGVTKSYYMIFVEIKRGREKAPSAVVQEGDIVYDPIQDAIYLIFRSGKLKYPAIKLGVVKEGLKEIPSLKSGSVEISFKDVSAQVTQ